MLAFTRRRRCRSGIRSLRVIDLLNIGDWLACCRHIIRTPPLTSRYYAMLIIHPYSFVFEQQSRERREADRKGSKPRKRRQNRVLSLLRGSSALATFAGAHAPGSGLSPL